MSTSSKNSSFSINDLVPDIRAGVLVSLLALPLSLGIALASGFPAVAGLLTAIAAGLIASWFKGAPLTIKGPAAGLIAIILGSVTDLGGGDIAMGYKKTLAVGVIAAVFQIVIALFRGASLGTLVPKSVVHGMLAAIGVIVISKQIHVLMGVPAQAKGPIGLLLEIPHSIMNVNPMIVGLGLVALLVVLGQKFWAKGPLRHIPPPLLALAIVIPLGIILGLHDDHGYDMFDHHFLSGHKFDVQVPHSILNAIVFPDFSALSEPTAWKYVIMLALVGSIESTLTVIAVDKLSKTKTPANVNRDLLSIGVANLAVAMVGGLPMISEVARSRANLDNGVKSHWSNFIHGLCLLLAVTFAADILELIPLSALAALLLLVGARLASWKHIQEAAHVGWDQALYFTTTLLVTLATDLLMGVFAGIIVKIIVHRVQGIPFGVLFGMNISEPLQKDGAGVRLKMKGALVFFKIPKIEKALAEAAKGNSKVVVDLTSVSLVDHTTMERLEDLAHEHDIELTGLKDLRGFSTHSLATRLIH